MPEASRVSRPTLRSLVRGIVDDAKQLVIGHYELRKYQTLRELAKAKAAAIYIGIGAVLAGIGAVLVSLMGVHLLQVASRLPLWSCYGIVGTVFILIAAALAYAGKKRL